MAGGEGFFIPATVQVSLEGLSQVEAQLRDFIARAKAAGTQGTQMVDPTTGTAATPEAVRSATGKATETARQGYATALAAGDEALAKVFKNLERRASESTLGLRRAGEGPSKPISPPKPEPAPPGPVTIGPQQFTAQVTGGGKRNKAQLENEPTGDPDQDLAAEKDAIKDLILSYRERARVNRQIAENQARQLDDGSMSAGVLDERIKAEAAEAQARRAYTGKLLQRAEPGQPATAGQSLLGDRAVTSANEKLIAAQQQNLEIAQRRAAGGIQIEATTKVLVSQYEREVSIEAAKMDLAQGNAASMAEEKVTRDELNREVAKEVRAQQDQTAIAIENAAKQKDQQEIAARTTLARAGEDPGALQGAELTARAAVVKRAEADRERTAVIRATTREDIEAAALKKLEEGKLRVAIHQQEREYMKQQIASGEMRGGTFFQRLQTAIKPTADKLPEEQLTGGQFVAEKFTRTAGFAVSGAILAGVTTGLAEMYKAATQLEAALVPLKGQLEALGKVDSFQSVRQGILGISNDTGVAAQDVAGLASAFLAFDQSDPAQAMTDTAAAAKLMAVSGQDLATVLSELVPAQKAFGLTAEQVGDQVIKASDQYGTSADDAAKFMGKISGVGAIAGRNEKELVALGGNLREAFGTSLEGAAEPINKAFDLIEKNTDRVLRIVNANPATAAASTEIARAIGQGDKSGAIVALQRASQDMTEKQKNALVTQLGSPQDAQVMVGVLNAAAGTLRDVAKAEAEAGSSGGALASRFDEVKNTLATAFETIKNAFANIGDALLRSGLGDALRDVAMLLGAIVGVTSTLVGAFADLNDVTGGALGHLMEMALVLGAIMKAQTLLTAAMSRGNKVQEEQLLVTRGTVASEEADTVAANEDAAAQQRLALARREAGDASVIAAEGSAASGGAAASETAATTAAPAAKMGVLQRSLAGGRFIKSAQADEAAAALGETTTSVGNLMASPLLTGAIVLTAAIAIKSKYDEMQGQVHAAGQNLDQALMTASDANVAKVANMQPDWIDSFQSWFFQEPTAAQRGQNQQAYREATPDLAQLGLTHWQAPKAVSKDVDKRKSDLQTGQQTLNKGFAEFYNAADKQALAAAAWSSGVGQQLLSDAGAVRTGGGGTVPVDETGAVAGARSSQEPLQVGDLSYAHVDWAKLREAATQDLDLKDPEYAAKLAFQQKFAEVERGSEGHTPGRKLQDLQKTLGQGKQFQGIVDAAGGDYEKAVGMMSQWGEETFTPFDELKAKLSSGRITESQFITEGKRSIDGLRHAAEATSGTEKETWLALIAEREKAVTDMVANSMLVDAAVRDKLDTVNSLTPKKNTAERHQAAMALKTYADRRADLPNLIAQDVETHQEQIAAIANPDARLAAMNRGVAIDPLARQTEIETSIREDPRASAMIQHMAQITNMTEEQVVQAIAKRAVERHLSVQEAAKQWAAENSAVRDKAQQTEAAARGQAAAFSGIATPEEFDVPTPERAALNVIQQNASKRTAQMQVQMAMDSHNKIAESADAAKQATDDYADAVAANRIDKSGVTDEKVQEAKAKKIRADQAYSDSLFEYSQLVRNRAVILAGKDPVKQNAAQMNIALAALDRANQVNDPFAREAAIQQIMQLQQAAGENQLNIVRGAMAITAAQDAEDPMRTAQDALQAAEFELANAQGDADQKNKTAAVIAAKRNVQNAISNSLSADAQLAITLANLRNDPVEAAAIAAREAKRKLDEAIAKGITDRSVLAPLEGQLAEANKAAFLAPINKQIEDLDWLYGMEKISLGEYISGLEAQLSQFEVNSKEYKDLALKIYNLKKQGQQDMQFNLPSNIALPTLYEARRLNQSRALGIGYTDARNVALTFNIDGAQDPAAVSAQIVSALDKSGLTGGQLYTPGVMVGMN